MDDPALERSYFQFRDFPCAIHSAAVRTRRSRVGSVFASAIPSRQSRRFPGGKASNAAPGKFRMSMRDSAPRALVLLPNMGEGGTDAREKDDRTREGRRSGGEIAEHAGGR